jgi:sporulation protein YlmC with PRC-barrel domain
MTERIGTGLNLVKLSDSEFVLEDRAQDVRGLDVCDSNGDEVGSVEDLYVDEEERKVRFLDVAAGGFFGLGEKRFLIPVEVVREVNEGGVVVNQGREKVAGSPPFDTGVVPQPSYQREVYDYYGYAGSHRGPYPGGA